jgi:hypothetical protein
MGFAAGMFGSVAAGMVSKLFSGGDGGGSSGPDMGATAAQANQLLDETQQSNEMMNALQTKSLHIQFWAKAMALVQETAKACMNAIMR